MTQKKAKWNGMLHTQVVTLKVGFSHDVRYTLPDALRAFLPEPTLIGLYGIEKNQVRLALARTPCLAMFVQASQSAVLATPVNRNAT